MELAELTDKAIDYILAGIDTTDPRLTDWERDFVEGINDKWMRNRWLSDRQKETLGKIWDKV